jgi:hypothetical protein
MGRAKMGRLGPTTVAAHEAAGFVERDWNLFMELRIDMA